MTTSPRMGGAASASGAWTASTVPMGRTLVVRSIGGVTLSGIVGDVFADGRDLRILQRQRKQATQKVRPAMEIRAISEGARISSSSTCFVGWAVGWDVGWGVVGCDVGWGVGRGDGLGVGRGEGRGVGWLVG